MQITYNCIASYPSKSKIKQRKKASKQYKIENARSKLENSPQSRSEQLMNKRYQVIAQC